jgi:hypothetical protein
MADADAVVRALEQSCASTSTNAAERSRARFDALSGGLLELFESKTTTDARAVELLKSTEDGLVKCVVDPDGEASATLAAMTLLGAYRRTGAVSMFSRVNEFLDVAASSRAGPFQKACVFNALGRLVEVFGSKLCGNASVFMRVACGNIRPGESAISRQAALDFIAVTCVHCCDGMDAKCVNEANKALQRLERDKESTVRAAAARALGGFVCGWSAARIKLGHVVKPTIEVDITTVVERIIVSLGDEDDRVRNAAANALVIAILSCCRAQAALSEPNESQGQDSYAQGMQAYLSTPFFAACKSHGVFDQRVRVGLASAWGRFIHEVVKEGMAEHHEIVSHTMTTLLSQPYDDDPSVCACVIYIVRVGCLAGADEACLHGTLSAAMRALESADVSRLLIALRTARDALDVIGSIDDDVWSLNVEILKQSLCHSNRHVQVEAALALRALALACPTKFLFQLQEAMKHLQKYIKAVQEHDSLVAAGTACHVSALVSIGEEFTCGLPANVLQEATTLGIACAMGPGSARVREGGWVVISACLAGSGADVASRMCGSAIKFAMSATFDAVVEAGVEGEQGEIYAAAAVAEALSAWLIGKPDDASDLLSQLQSSVEAAERIFNTRLDASVEEHSKSLFRYRVFELLNAIDETCFYEELHGRIVALCQRASSDRVRFDTQHSEMFLREQLNDEDTILGPWSSHDDSHLNSLSVFEGATDSPHPRVWIGLSEAQTYPRTRSMRSATRRAQGLQLAKVFATSPELRMGILAYFLNVAHQIVNTPLEARAAYESGEFTAKKSNAIGSLQNKFGSPFKSRRTKSIDEEDLLERASLLTSLSADILCAIKSLAQIEKNTEASIKSSLIKILNVMRYAQFANVSHWRAMAEIEGQAALMGDEDAGVGALIEASSRLLDIDASSPTRKMAVLSIASSFRNMGVIALRRACTSVVSNLLRSSMQVDQSSSSHLWSTHAIGVIASCAGQNFVRDAEDCVDLALALTDAPHLLMHESGYMSRIINAHLINTAMSAIGPEMKHDSRVFKRAESLIKVLTEVDEPGTKFESTQFMQLVAVFTPRTPRARDLISKLRNMLQSTANLATTRTAIVVLHQLLERDSSNLASQQGIDEELLNVLDRESDPEIRRITEHCVTLFVRDKCRTEPRGAMDSLAAVALYAPIPKNSQANSSVTFAGDEDDIEVDGLTSAAEEVAHVIEQGAPKLSTRLFAAKLLARLPSFVGAEPEHRSLEKARSALRKGGDKRWMALHSQAAFDVAYRLAVSPISALHSPGLDMFTNFMHFWAKDVDPDSAADDDYRTMCVLEQFQAQLLSAMRATNAEEASLEAFLSLLRLVSSALTSGITGDDEAMTMRLANVVTKIADEWFQGTSSILCGKACDERVAEQARKTLVISMARIASKASGVISEDLLEPINREWLRYLEGDSLDSVDEFVTVISACSTLKHDEKHTSYLRELCMRTLACGFRLKSIDANHAVALLCAFKVIVANDNHGVLCGECEIMRDALARYDSSAIRGEIIQVIESLRVHERVHSETVSPLLRLVCGILWNGRVDDESFTSAFKTVIHLSNHDPMGQTALRATMEQVFAQCEGQEQRSILAIEALRSLDADATLRAARSGADFIAQCARDAIKRYYANEGSSVMMELVSQSLQLWASVFVFARDRGAEDFCLTSLAVFLAIAVDVTSPADTTSVAIDTETGVLASQLLVTLAAAHAQPFREVVGQLSDESKSRLQRLLNFNKPTGPATVGSVPTPLKPISMQQD